MELYFGDLEGFLETNEFFSQMLDSGLGGSIIEQFVVMIISMMAIVAAVPVLMIMLKVRGEEKKGRTEQILARKVSKVELLKSYFLPAFRSSFWMLFALSFGLWSASVGVMEEGISLLTMTVASFVYLPAIWIMLGVRNVTN